MTKEQSDDLIGRGRIEVIEYPDSLISLVAKLVTSGHIISHMKMEHGWKGDLSGFITSSFTTSSSSQGSAMIHFTKSLIMLRPVFYSVTTCE